MIIEKVLTPIREEMGVEQDDEKRMCEEGIVVETWNGGRGRKAIMNFIGNDENFKMGPEFNRKTMKATYYGPRRSNFTASIK